MADTATSTRKGIIEISPGRRDDPNKENDVPVLSLIQFSKAPFISFGCVKVGTSRSVVLRIENPMDDVEAEVRVDKIPSSKGFSVDHSAFTIQPESSFGLTVTWTPAEEGGVRELIVFNANGVLKHQAVMLGRAEAPKKKKKSLWDSIKKKKEGAKVGALRRKKTELPLKMAANKTFQVSREPRYKRDKARSPLASLNEGKAEGRRSFSNLNDNHLHKPEELKASIPRLSLDTSDQENLHLVQRSSPAVLVVPTAKLMDASLTTENRNLTKILNKTLSPIGTPERFKKLMPRIHTQSPALAPIRSDSEESTQSPVPSLKDALALIDSDLSFIGGGGGDSSCVLSDSLEPQSGSGGVRVPVLKALPLSPGSPDESNAPRLTFFVSKKAEETAKKPSFDSATVVKGKAPAEEEGGVPSARKIKKSRRRLLEKTLELSDSSAQCDSGKSSPRLPVIDQDTGSSWLSDGALQVLGFFSSSPSAVASPPSACFSFRVSSPPPPPPPPPPPSVPALAVSSSSPTGSASSRSSLCHNLSSTPNALGQDQAALEPEEDDLFPVQMVAKSKKRKSEEFLRSEAKAEGASKADRVKRSRVAAARTDTLRAARERSAAQRLQSRPAGSVRSASSLKGSRCSVPAQAKQPSSKVASRVAPSLKSSQSVKKVMAVAQSKLSFIKPIQTAIPRHPMPFAAKNMFFDERWLEKQERGFTWWINYVLTPDDFKVNTEVAKVNAVSLAMGHDDRYSVPNAPTNEEMSFSTYTARRKLNRLRRSACQLFTSDAMVKAIQRLEVEVEARRLLVRKDRHLWKDIGERKKVLNWLLSYNPLWLRIGLETIFGELISLESNSDTLGLAMFILQRLLWNPDIAAEFRHAKVPHLYKDGHEEALSRFTLKKLLLLVCFLDKAKESRLIEHNPCLFCVDAEFKTTKDLLLAFSRDFLSGEGILPRHLGYLGLPVSHAQKPLDEFNFAVKNLAVDLKCGIRLVRVMELLVQDWSLSAKLRLPAISRLQKVHNVDMALQVLKGKGVDLKDEHGSAIESRDVVDGHREKTLNLLWKIIFAFHVEVILDEDQLRDEIGFLRRSLRTKRRLVSLRADRGPQPSPARKSNVPAFQHSSTKISLLMDWARAVCDFYGLRVENFTVTFSDGRVLCYLIHHYHPGLLRGEAVSHSTSQTVECSPRGRLELSCAASDSDSSFDSMPPGLSDSPSVEFKELLENEKNNFRLVNTAVAFLGGVPAMINPADMSNTIPSEKVVISYLTFLCTRLLDLRNETRAARVIQAAWRTYRLKKDMQLYKERNMAAVKIQRLVRTFLQRRRAARQSRAAVVIQALWRGHAARHRLRLHRQAELCALHCQAATVIQAQWRMFCATRTYHRLRYNTIVIQAQWRMRRAVAVYSRLRWATNVLQKRSRAAAAARRDRGRYLALRAATVTIQTGFRRWRARKTERENHAAKVIQGAFKKWYGERTDKRAAAAVRIQSWYRMQRCLGQYTQIKRSTVLLQALCRGHTQRRRFELLKRQRRSAIIIQSVFRGHAVRKEAARQRWAAAVIQRRFRATLKRNGERETFVRMKCAAVTVQAAYRGKVTREFLKRQQRSATVIQAAFRGYAARRRYLALRDAAVLIQQRFRAGVSARDARKDFRSLKNAAVVVQALWRGRADRKRMENLHRCAALIQAHYRGRKARVNYRSMRASAVVLQRHYRAYVAGREARESYLRTRAACVTLQAAFRGRRVRTELRGKHQAATVIQASVRMFLSRRRFVLLQSAAIILQCRYRALVLGRAQQSQYRELKQAAIKIQSFYRGFRVREELQKRSRAATVIQAQFRMYRTRMSFLATKCAAYILQDRYRAKRLRDREFLRYKSMKAATVLIQAAYRGHIVRRKVAEMHRAAVVIQRKFLALRDRRRFTSLKTAALVCQRRFRAATRARTERQEYLSMRKSAVCLQAAFRGNRVRKQLRVQSAAAVMIQSVFRMYRQRCYYNRLRWAAAVLQERHRANQEMRREMQTLHDKRKAAVILQAAFRGTKCRRVLKQRSRAAAVIQRAYRARCQRRKYMALKSTVIAVQRRYRANVAAKEEMQNYQNMRRAVVILQAAYRGQQARSEVARWHRAATVIQSVYRKRRAEVQFQAMRLAAIVIQRFYRGHLTQRQDRDNFLQLRRSAVVLQAAYRSYRVRCHVAEMHQAATVIQANYRMHKQRSAYRRQQWAACVLQNRYRATVAAKEQMQKYQNLRRMTVILQAAYRGQQVRREVNRMHQAATVIQSVYRKRREEVKFQAMLLAAIIIQRRYRSLLLQRNDRENFLQLRRSAVVLQAAFRGQCARRNVAHMHLAATVIQANYRMHQQRSAYRRQQWAACILQQRFRAAVVAKEQMQNYQNMRRAIVILQAAYRGQQVRREVNHMHQAATVIQSVYRKHQEEVKFQAMRLAAVIIQRRYRSLLLQRNDRENFLQLRRSAVVLQAAFRGQCARRNVAHMHLAATVIQANYRMHMQQSAYRRQQWAACVLQSRYRATVAAKEQMRKYQNMRRAIVILQAAYREQQVRREVNHMHQAATLIQSVYRQRREEVKFQAMRLAAIIIQRRYRSLLLQRNDRENFLQLRHSAVVLQAAFRGQCVRRNVAHMHLAATVIQANYRMHQQQSAYRRQQWAACILQSRYRATVAAKEQMQKYQNLRRMTVILQAAYRGQQVRREVNHMHQAATLIQSVYRKHQEEVKFQAMRLAAVIIQRRYRSLLLQRNDRENFLQLRRSAVVLQAAFRGQCARRNVAHMHLAATVIQAKYRMHQQQSAYRRQQWAACVLQQRFRALRQKDLEVRRYQEVRKATLVLQAAYRGLQSRRDVKERHQAARLIQRVYRARRQHRKYLTLKSSVLIVQRRYRATAAAKEQMQNYQNVRRAAVILQAACRGQQVRREVARWHQAATVIQSVYRKRREEVKFQAMRLAAVIIQRRYRSLLLQRNDRENFLERKRSAIVLQAAFRGWRVRRETARRNQAAVVIQASWRGLAQRRELQRQRAAAVTLQRWIRAAQRGKMQRDDYIRTRRAAVTLQRRCRAWITRRREVEAAAAERRRRFTAAAFHHLCAMKIQRALRAHRALESARKQIHSVVTVQRWVRARLQRRRYLEDRSKVVAAQRAVRSWLARRHQAARVIQRHVRDFLLRRRQSRVQQGIVKAQALWRGHRSRRINDNPKLVKLRRRLRQVSAAVREEDKLCNKTSSALDYLLRYKHFSFILEALKNLETATRLSPECCERLVESGATAVIVTLIRCCNRSVPCMDVITSSIQILLNLSKYHKTTEAVYSVENSVDTLLDLLQRYREKAGDKVAEKGGSIFTKACFLLALLLQDKRRATEVMKLPKVLERIRSIYRLTARKHKMDAERSVIKQKMNASVNGSFYVQATPRKSKQPPRFAPDWVLRKDKLQDVVDPLRAIHMVADTLDIVL